MNIRQCIPADRERVSAFLQRLGGQAGGVACAFELRLSLIADDGAQVQGVALFRNATDSTSRELAVAVAGAGGELLHLLIDKALAKLHAHGIHKCTVILMNRDEPQTVWNQTRWSGTQSAGEGDAAAAGGSAGAKPKKPRKAKTAAEPTPATAA